MKTRATLALAASVCIGPTIAETLHKHVDKDGKVTYSDAIPPEQGGKASRLRVDPTGNTVIPFRAPAEPGRDEQAPPRRQDGATALVPGTTLHHQHLTQEARVRDLREAEDQLKALEGSVEF